MTRYYVFIVEFYSFFCTIKFWMVFRGLYLRKGFRFPLNNKNERGVAYDNEQKMYYPPVAV